MMPTFDLCGQRCNPAVEHLARNPMVEVLNLPSNNVREEID
jgi:hypothetical protein